MPKSIKVVLIIFAVLVCSVSLAQGKKAVTSVITNDPNSKPNENIFATAPTNAIPLNSWLTQGFEGATFPPTGWDTLNAGGPKRWIQTNTRAHTGTYSAKIPNEVSGFSNDWLFTPRVGPIAAGDSVVFWCLQLVNTYYETLFVRVDTFSTGTQRDTTHYIRPPLGLALINTLSWQRFAFSLSAYAGKSIYLAFWNKNGLGQDTVFLDDVDIKKPLPSVAIIDTSGYEGNSGTKSFGFYVTLSTSSSDTVKINYTTVDSTATTTDVDYALTSGQLVFAPGVTSQRIGVTVNGDTKRELNEFFKVVLTTKTNSTYTDSLGIGTILNDDSIPTISISDSTGYEGNSSTKSFGFYISVSNPSYLSMTVHCLTVDSTATVVDGDYVARTDTTLTFAPGDTIRKRISVTVNGDTKRELNEFFKVVLITPTNVRFTDSLGLGTIQNDDSMPTLSINDVSVAEGAGNAVFTVTLLPASGLTVTTSYATADSTAFQPGDYTSKTGLLTFNAGVTVRTCTIPIIDDAIDENTEYYKVALTSPTNATYSDSLGVGTITDNDATPTLSIGDAPSVVEGNNAIFTVNLSAASGLTVTTSYATQDSTALGGGTDYTTKSGVLTFTAGVTARTCTIPTIDDALDENTEYFKVALYGPPTNATYSDSLGVGTITDNDPTPTITIRDSTGLEGHVGTKTFGFYVTLSNPSAMTITVDYYTADNTATILDNDYNQVLSTPITFSPGVTSQRVTVTVNGDYKYETNEIFKVLLKNPVNAVFGDSIGEGTILNDDAVPTISISDTTGLEGNSGTKSFGFYVTLSNPSYQTITVKYGTADGTATIINNDYVANSDSLTFYSGETSKRIGVDVIGDIIYEPNETFYVILSGPTNASFGDSLGLGTIINEDVLHDVSVESIIKPADTVRVCIPFNPVVIVGNNSFPSQVESCALNLKIWRFRTKIDSLCHISVDILDTLVVYDSTVVIIINPGDTAITMPAFHPTVVDLTWLGSPTYHMSAARVSMLTDQVPSNNFKQKRFVVTGRKNDLQVENAALMRGSSILRTDTVITGTSYNAISVVSNIGTVRASFRTYFNITRMKTSQVVYSQYLDKTINPKSYSCIYYYTGWVPVDTGLYKVMSWITSRPGVDSTPDNNLYERYYTAVRPGASGPLSSSEEKIKVFAMYQNRPNPFFATTVIKWQIPIESKVSISVYDATGRIIKSLVNGSYQAGYYNTTWDCTNDNNQKVAAGVYFYEMKADNYSARRKMVISH